SRGPPERFLPSVRPVARRRLAGDSAPIPHRRSAMKFGLCQELFGERSWREQCQTMARLRDHGVEMAPFTLAHGVNDVSSDRRAPLRREAEEHGLEVIGLHWLLAKTTGLHLTTSDAAVRRATADYLIELADCCADIGGTILVFGSPGQRSLEPGVTTEQAL